MYIYAYLFIYLSTYLSVYMAYTIYGICSNKHRAPNKRCPLTSTEPFGICTEISASPLISTAPINPALIRIVTIISLVAKPRCIWN